MKAIVNSKLVTAILVVLFQAHAHAQDLVSEASKKETSDIFIGYYIIAGIISFGMIAYVIFNLVEKNQKDDGSNVVNKHYQNRHHRIVKKTA